jgi:hypothetical protein
MDDLVIDEERIALGIDLLWGMSWAGRVENRAGADWAESLDRFGVGC